ncbi:hypothetical protein ACA364_10690 [Enterococcus faecium]|uniref:hypothetical protein n=1 Tax=Enterococcus faecium TaxID=1352 RepID=UPI003B5E62F8
MYQIIVFLSIIFFLNERLYIHSGQVSGVYNVYISIYFFLLFLLGLFLFKIQFTTKELLLFTLLITGIGLNILYRNSVFSESIRYLLDISIIFFCSKIVLNSIVFLSKCIIINGFISQMIFQNGSFSERGSGFFVTSPTNFSVIICLSLILLVEHYRHQDTREIFSIIPYTFLSFYLIYSSESRSVLMYALMYVVIVISKRLYNNRNFFLRFALISLLIISVPYFYQILTEILNQRDNGTESNSTRLFLYSNLVKNYFANPVGIVIGNGAGSAYNLVSGLVGMKFPVHFDFLAIAYDFGIFFFGLLAAFVKLIYRRLNIAIVGIIVVANFHNLLLFPLGLTYTFLIWSYLIHSENENSSFIVN